MDLELTGKRALITGSSAGIGVAIAELLAAEGVAVIIHGRDAARIDQVATRIAAAGGRVAAAPGDLSTDEGATQVGETALAAFGGIDILVNNAGGAAEHGDQNWFASQPAAWAETYQRNVLAGVRLIHLLTPGMRERGWGRIINIATAAGITPTAGLADYGPSKAAMLNMSLGLSKALRHSGVTSNAVSPGMIRTEGLMEFLAAVALERGWGNDIARAEQHIVKMTGQTVTRIGEVRDIALAVAMLASPKSDFINGTNLHVDGGISPSLH